MLNKKKKYLQNLFYDRAILQNKEGIFADAMKQKTAYEGRMVPVSIWSLFLSISQALSYLEFHLLLILSISLPAYTTFGCGKSLQQPRDISQYMIPCNPSAPQVFRHIQDYRPHLQPQVRDQSPSPPHG